MSYKLSFTAQELEALLAKQRLEIVQEVSVSPDSFIVVNVDFAIANGSEIKFKSPADCSQIIGLRVLYKVGEDVSYQDFTLADAHGNNVGDIDHLFAASAVVNVILDVDASMAFVQNADTNAYIERTFIKTINGATADPDGNVNVALTDRALTADALGGIAAEDYATKAFVNTEISKAQLSGEDDNNSIDLTGFATKEYVDEAMSETVTKTDIIQIDKGGLGTTALDGANGARQTLNYIGNNPVVPDTDTPATWVAFGTGFAYISANNKVVDQPGTYGMIENFVFGSNTSAPGLVRQIWRSQNASGYIYERAGTISGNKWYSTWIRTFTANTTIPVENGGTGETTKPAARQALSYIGTNPSTITADNDTPANWIALGSGHVYISDWKKLPTQPKKQGIIENIVCADNTIKQIWHSQDKFGETFERAGDTADGWYTDGWKQVGVAYNNSADLGRAGHITDCQNFVAEMNRVASNIGMKNSIFKTPSGYPSNFTHRAAVNYNYNSKTTAYDILRLLIAARHTPTVLDAMGTTFKRYVINKTYANYVNHSIVASTSAWHSWANENGYKLVAAKGGSLSADSTNEELTNGIFNMSCIIEHNSDLYAVAVLGLQSNSADKELCRDLVHDLIEQLKTGAASNKILAAASRSGDAGTPVCMGAVKLTQTGTFQDDIAELDRLDDTGKRIAAVYNENDQRIAASLAKVINAITYVRHFDNHYCTLTHNDIINGSGLTQRSKDETTGEWKDSYGEQAMHAGDTISTEDALYIMLLISDNSLATMLARDFGSKMTSDRIGKNPVSEDTVSAWAAFGSGSIYIDNTDEVVNRPINFRNGLRADYGLVTSNVYGDLITQEWRSFNANNLVYHRAGSIGNGWYAKDENGKGKWIQSLDENITPEHIGAAAEDHSHSAADVGARPNTWTPTAADVGAAPSSHVSDKSNPHSVTKEQVGLGNVPNVATNDQTPTFTAASTMATLTSGEKLSVAFGKIAKAITDLISHIGNKSNPHGVTKSQVGLGSVDNTSDSAKPVSTAQATAIADAKSAGTTAQTNLNTHTSNKSNPHSVTKTQVGLGNVPNVATNDQTPTYSAASTLATLTSGEKLSVSMGKIMKAISDLIYHIGNKSNPHGVTKSQVGLGNVDNTSDANKPVSTAQATAIADAKSAGTTAQTNLNSHTSNKSNPHGVTKAQVGLGNVPNVATNDQTPSYSQASSLANLTSGEKLSVSMGKIMKAIADLISHIGNKSNPHGVTAAQAGAVPTSRTVNGKALSSNITLSASDVSARPNTWMPTASEVGAAPDGYGLGENIVDRIDDINVATPARFFRTTTANGTPANGPAFPQSSRNVGIVIPYATDEVAQFLIRTSTGSVRIRRLYGGEWIEEWVNPPMAAGVEYRTVKRYEGEPVYTKLVDFEALPNATNKNVAHSTALNQNVISLFGLLSNGVPFTLGYNWDRTGDNRFYVDATKWHIRIVTENDMSALTAKVIVEYVKESD